MQKFETEQFSMEAFFEWLKTNKDHMIKMEVVDCIMVAELHPQNGSKIHELRVIIRNLIATIDQIRDEASEACGDEMGYSISAIQRIAEEKLEEMNDAKV